MSQVLYSSHICFTITFISWRIIRNISYLEFPNLSPSQRSFISIVTIDWYKLEKKKRFNVGLAALTVSSWCYQHFRITLSLILIAQVKINNKCMYIDFIVLRGSCYVVTIMSVQYLNADADFACLYMHNTYNIAICSNLVNRLIPIPLSIYWLLLSHCVSIEKRKKK